MSNRSLLVVLFLLLLIPHPIFAQDLGQILSHISIDALLFQVEWSADDTFVAVATDDGVKIYDPALQLIDELNQGYYTYSISWSPTNDRLAITRQNSFEIWIWDATDTRFELEETVDIGKYNVIVEWSPDGQKLVTLGIENFQGPDVTQYGTIQFWETSTWQLTVTVPTRYTIVLSPQFSTSTWLAWNPANAAEIVVLGLAVDSQGQIISRDNSDYLDILDTNTGLVTTSIPITAIGMYSVSWSPSGEIIALGSDLGVILYDVASSQLIVSYPLAIDVETTAWSPDGTMILGDQGVAVVSINRLLGELPDIDAATIWVDWNHDGTRIARIMDGGILEIIDTTTFPDIAGMPTVTPFISRTPIPTITATP